MSDKTSIRLPELLQRYPEIELIELGDDTPTSEKAAEACGLELSSIAKTLIIKTEKEWVLAEGGERPKLIKISPKLIAELNSAQIVDIAIGQE